MREKYVKGKLEKPFSEKLQHHHENKKQQQYVHPLRLIERSRCESSRKLSRSKTIILGYLKRSPQMAAQRTV